MTYGWIFLFEHGVWRLHEMKNERKMESRLVHETYGTNNIFLKQFLAFYWETARVKPLCNENCFDWRWSTCTWWIIKFYEVTVNCVCVCARASIYAFAAPVSHQQHVQLSYTHQWIHYDVCHNKYPLINDLVSLLPGSAVPLHINQTKQNDTWLK